MTFEGLLALLDPRADRRGREFERICGWFLRYAPEYRSQVKQVWLWDDWPGRWAADAGIDLVAETFTGELWAVQAKAYDPAYAIKKSDIDSFLSESAGTQFSYRLLIATTDRIGTTARRTLARQENAGQVLRSQLAVADVDWPRSPDDLAPPRPKRKRPRPHQSKAINAVAEGFRTANRGQLIMACGTGKTLAACFLAQMFSARRVLVLVPSLSLLSQTLREWATASDFRYLAVCSDETVVGAETDAVVTSTSEFGFPVTTDPAVIARFLRQRGDETRVVFATYQSAPRIAEAQAARTPAFDLVIADEAHRCAGPEAGVFATVLDPAKIKAGKRLFMTATPRFFTGRVRKEAREADWEIASMDDETRFGPVLHRLSFSEAIEQDLLADYQVVVVGVSDQSYGEMAERGAFVTTDGVTVTDARTLARQVGLLRAMRNHNLHRVVSFHSRIGNARRFAVSILGVADWLPRDLAPDGTLWAEHVSGEMSSGEREVRLNRLRAVGGTERAVLCNARCLAEGVDVPSLDGVAFIDPRRSQVDVVQAVGRAIRKAEDKTVGTVVIPVFVDERADPESVLNTGDFDRVWQIVKALRAHDDVLAEELDELRRELGRQRTSAKRPSKLKLDLPVAVGERFVRAFDTRLLTEATDRWEFWLGLLEQYVGLHGDADVAQSYETDGYKLGVWVNGQRAKRRDGSLEPDRIRLLEALPGWAWDARASRWERGFAHLVGFANDHGHTRVPVGYMANDFKLRVWVGTQRGAYRRGVIPSDRVARLEAVPGWTWDERAGMWEENFSRLTAYAHRHGHAQVPPDHLEDGRNLGNWIHNQRTRRRKGTLSSDRAARLESLPGWMWEPYDGAWEQGFEHLLRFVEANGSARNIPKELNANGYDLGGWVNNQRHDYRTGRLARDRSARLNQLPGWVWNAREARWDERLAVLQRFAEREGHTRVNPQHKEADFRLGLWVETQRNAYRTGKLPPDRVAQLEALPGWAWRPRGSDWEEGYAALVSFVNRLGHALVPQGYSEDGFRLGGWVTTQRLRHRQGKLAQARSARLEALKGWSWNPFDDAWEQGFERLQQFAEREKQASVPVSHYEGEFALGRWVNKQRQAFRAGRLESERIRRLEALPGWLWVARAPRPV